MHDKARSTKALGDLLTKLVVPNTFCETLWPYGDATVEGAVNLLKRITHSPDADSARNWLNVMNRGGLIRWLRPGLRVLYNPRELDAATATSANERNKGHVLDPQKQYGNLLALKELLHGARGSIRWYEQHQTAKVLEVLYREIEAKNVPMIRILSGPVEISDATKDEFKRFRKEMVMERGVTADWRVLGKEDARSLHGRFFITEGYARNLPPLNLILAGTVDEILPSNATAREFDEWWERGTDIEKFQPLPKG